MKILSNIDQKALAVIGIALMMTLTMATMGPGCAAAGGKATVRLPARISVNGDALRLGEIAGITGDDPALVQQLKRVNLGDAPAPGDSRKIADRHIRLRLKHHGVDLARIRLQMPRHIVISRTYMEVSEAAIKKAVVAFIHRETPWDRSNVKISRIRLRGSNKLPRGKITYKVLKPEHSDLLGSVCLPVQFFRNGAMVKKSLVTAKVEVMTDALVAKRPLAKYQRIEPDHVQLKKVKLSRSSRGVLFDMGMVVGKRAKRRIKQGAVLTTNMIETPPLVNRGDIVEIIIQTKGLRITTLGKAKNKGGLGEKIQVQNLESKKYIHGTVIDEKTVRVDI
ncbi:MAG: flagellar basal body P-ring formation protein FlgA [Desulfobacterales bacterium]|nr:flagellar basal body P-ring formation protein FlgA [Desulfobacterales bacterium]